MSGTGLRERFRSCFYSSRQYRNERKRKEWETFAVYYPPRDDTNFKVFKRVMGA